MLWTQLEKKWSQYNEVITILELAITEITILLFKNDLSYANIDVLHTQLNNKPFSSVVCKYFQLLGCTCIHQWLAQDINFKIIILLINNYCLK